MPHFIIDCSENMIDMRSPEDIMQNVYNAAESSQLFDMGDIKVRINPYKHYNNGNTKNNFIHIFTNIMEGRSTEQKKKLSLQIVSELKQMFSEVPIISINIRDFEKATYCNKLMINNNLNS